MAIDLSVKSRGFEFRNRLKIALNVNDVERSIKELDAATNMMARLRISGQQSDYYETSPSHSAAKLANFLNKVRMHAAQLHSAISHCWTSNCHSGHAARFYLEDRHECVKKKRTDLQFRILFGDQGTAGSYTCFSNTLVHVRLQDEPSCEADYTSIGNTQIGMPSSQQAATGRTVAFSPPIQTQARSVALRNLPSRSPGDVVDLCLELQQSQRNAAVLELYLPPGAGLRALQVTANATPRSVTTSSISDAPVSLGEVLRWYSEASSNDRARVWNFQQRMALAAKVASSALQLGSTRWLSDSWSAGQVLFDGLNTLTSPGGNAVPRFDATSPFLVTKFSANRVDADNEQDAATDLVEVGIRLLEIWHGKQLEVFARESGIALTPSQRLRREAAGQWLEQTEQDILPFYLRPIAYCLEAPTSRLFRNPDWTDTEFHRLVCEFVVQPLFSGCTATML